jgi:hypothetical protein
VSSPAQPGPDDAPQAAPGESHSLPKRPGNPAEPDNTVTTIMPIIAPWPEPGTEPPAPPALTLPAQRAGDGPTPPATARVQVQPRVPPADVDQPIDAVDVDPPNEPPRPGPVALDEDSWEDRVTPVLVDPEPAGRPGPSTRLWVMVGLIVAGLLAAVAIPFVLSGRDTGDQPTAAGLPTAQDEPPQISASSGSSQPGSVATAAAASPLPPSTAAAVPGAPTEGTGAPTSRSTSAVAPTSTAPPTTSAPVVPPFTPVTFEAENGTRTGSAGIWDGYPNASGGRIVRNIGNWGGTPGTLTISGVNIPSTGRYTITIYYVHIDGEINRSATVTVSGNPALNVGFVGSSTCCQTKVLANLTIGAGVHTILFANSTGHAPSIDKVVVSRS